MLIHDSLVRSTYDNDEEKRTIGKPNSLEVKVKNTRMLVDVVRDIYVGTSRLVSGVWGLEAAKARTWHIYPGILNTWQNYLKTKTLRREIHAHSPQSDIISYSLVLKKLPGTVA
jgi:hypothetical protein